MRNFSKPAPTLYGIIAFKLIRGVLLMILAMKAYTMVAEDLRPLFDAAVKRMKLDPETEFFEKLGSRIDAITPVNLEWVATGVLLYGVLSLGEGIGLILRSRWVGLLVVAESGFFVPVETYALVRDPSLPIVAILILNIAIVVYLHRNRERLFSHGQVPQKSAALPDLAGHPARDQERHDDRGIGVERSDPLSRHDDDVTADVVGLGNVNGDVPGKSDLR